MVQVQKLSRSVVIGRGRHVVRWYNIEYPPPDHIESNLSNRNIHVSKGGIIVVQEHPPQYQKRIDEAIEEHQATRGHRLRRDAIPAYELVMTRSDLGPEEKNFDNKTWLWDTVKWVQNRFGAENIVGGCLHMDELDRAGRVHPHIHFIMTPGISNEKGRELSFARTFGRVIIIPAGSCRGSTGPHGRPRPEMG